MSATGAARHPLIGISAGRKTLETSVGPLRHFVQPVYYVEAILAAGGIPFILPPMASSTRERPNSTGWFKEIPEVLDGLLITGGEDVEPIQYGQTRHPTVKKVDALRDQFEIAMARCAFEMDLPLLGVCRGPQVINVAAGGTLIQDLPSQQPGPIVHMHLEMTEEAHEIEIAPGSRLSTIIGKGSISTNSAHHQAVNVVATQLRPVAWAKDGVVEAIESPSHRWLVAVQWHPEMLYESHPIQRRLFEAFVEAARHK